MGSTTPKNAAWRRNRLEQLGRRFRAWAVGFGPVGLHVAVFLVVATGLILVDLYRSPDQLTVDDSLRTWGSIVALHALAVTVFQIVRWAIHEEQVEAIAEPMPATPQLSTTVTVPDQIASANGGSWWRDLPSRWRSLMEPQDAAVTTVATELPSANGHAPNDIQWWPAGHTQSIAIQPGAWPTRPADAAPPVNGTLGVNGADYSGPDPARWSWVEAAAAAWLTPREPDQPAQPDQLYTPAESTPPTPPPPDEPDTPSSTA